MSYESDQIKREIKNRGLKEAMMSDVVGMPDERDREFIRRLILRYEREHPGFIKTYRDSAKQWFQMGGEREKYGLAGKQANMRLIFELPVELGAAIEMHYPTMFRDKKHFRWFVKNFRELMIPEKY